MKRAFDLLLALVLAVPAAVIVAVLALPVWLDTRASPLFVQTRIGRGQRPFRLLKLRTMRRDAPHVASHEAAAALITRTGHLLRRTKIDELPQIWNVLIGQMSFVGPRPCLPSQAELIEHRRRLGVDTLRPGITGPAQVLGIDMSTPERLAHADAAYLGEWSLGRDLALLWTTALGRASGDAVRR